MRHFTGKIQGVLIVFVAVLLLSSCTSINKTVKEPNVRVELNKNDFQLSDQVSAQATKTQVLGIDFQRLFSSSSATLDKDADVMIDLAAIPVVGDVVADDTQSYALYELMQQNPGWDVVFFPQFHKTVERPIGIPFIYQVTTVRATARLGKLEN